ncbi:hypothetical protein LCGC14_0235590 [marine sediment metagenome]|uniref:Uncharacterized protein n=1 Tax=marine sediment metagenome TaxID=412755 RepID=A0A0F9XD66_9ZZZZ
MNQERQYQATESCHPDWSLAAPEPTKPRPGEIVRLSRPSIGRPDLPEHTYIRIVKFQKDPIREPGRPSLLITEAENNIGSWVAYSRGQAEAIFKASPPAPPSDEYQRGSGAWDAWRLGYADALDGVASSHRVLPGGLTTSYNQGWKAANAVS